MEKGVDGSRVTVAGVAVGSGAPRHYYRGENGQWAGSRHRRDEGV